MKVKDENIMSRARRDFYSSKIINAHLEELQPSHTLYIILKKPSLRRLPEYILTTFSHTDRDIYEDWHRNFGKTIVMYGDLDEANQKLHKFEGSVGIAFLPSSTSLADTRLLFTVRQPIEEYIKSISSSHSPFEISFNEELKISLGIFINLMTHLLDEGFFRLNLREVPQFSTCSVDEMLKIYASRPAKIRFYGGPLDPSRRELERGTSIGVVYKR